MKRLLLLIGASFLSLVMWSCGGGASGGKTNPYLGEIPLLVQNYNAEKADIKKAGEEFLEKNKNSTDVSVFTKYAEEAKLREDKADQILKDGIAKASETLVGSELPLENQDQQYTVSVLKITAIDWAGIVTAEGTLTVNESLPLSSGTAYITYQVMDNAGVPIVADGIAMIQNSDYKVKQAASGEQFPIKVILNAHKYPAMTNFDKVVFCGTK